MVFTAGLHGSGKSVLSESASEQGFNVYSMGDAVREEVRRRGQVPTNAVISALSTQLRRERGERAVAELTMKVFDVKGDRIVFDGLRSLDERSFFQETLGKGILVSVHASPKTRYERWLLRKRVDDPSDFESFLRRDMNDLSFGLGSLMVMADYHLVNESVTREQFKSICAELLRRLLHEAETH
ncbi:MAG: AAA family ATPase [Thermoprotei archaeon]